MRFLARWEEELAPETVRAFKAILPFEDRIIHCRWSGESNWIPWGDRDLGHRPGERDVVPPPRRARALPRRPERDRAAVPLRLLQLRLEGGPAVGEPLRHARRGPGAAPGAGQADPLAGRAADLVPRDLSQPPLPKRHGSRQARVTARGDMAAQGENRCQAPVVAREAVTRGDTAGAWHRGSTCHRRAPRVWILWRCAGLRCTVLSEFAETGAAPGRREAAGLVRNGRGGMPRPPWLLPALFGSAD